MKYLFSIFILIAFGTNAFSGAPKKCSGDAEYTKGLGLLKDYTLVKDYRVSLGTGKKGEPAPSINFPVSLTKGMKYKLFAVNHPDNLSKMIVSIYSNAKKEVLLATTYSSNAKKHYEFIEFDCKTTGTFYIFFQFDESKEGCGVGFFCVNK